MPSLDRATWRYILSMLSLSATHLVLVSVVAVVMDRIDKVLPVAPIGNVICLVVINALGAYWLFRPIDRFLRGKGDRKAALQRVERLTALSVAWGTLLVSSLTTFALFGLEVLCPGCDAAAVFPFRLSMLIIFTFFCGTYLYFLIDDCVACLRAELFRRHEIAFKPGRGRVLHKFFVAFFAVGVIPGSLAFLEPWIFADIRPLQGISVTQAYLFDLIVAMLMAGTAFYFIQRNLARPVDMLLNSVRRVAAGDLKTRSPVLTDDEFGTLACNFNQMVEGLGEREFLRETFGRYVPEEIAQEILANRGVLAPQRRIATVLYSDIAGFTTVCEGIAPEAVVAMLNDYFSALVEIIHRHGGVVTQFQGDAALAVFNVPVENPNHAVNAIRAALEIEAVTSSREFGSGNALPTRIGVNTGTVVAGPVGAGDRLNYTIHGDAVNTAARLEQLNKEHGTSIMVSSETRDAAAGSFTFTELGETQIRGKTEPTTVFSVST